MARQGLWRLALLAGWGRAAGSYDVVDRVSIGLSASGRYQVVSSRQGVLGLNGTVRGAGGMGYAEAAKMAGADALRTWGLQDLPAVLPAAEAKGLRVSAGIWLTHWPGSYENCSGDLSADPFWRQELATFLAAVRQYKNSSALLWWTVGNEMELEVNVLAGNECVWRRLEWIVQAVKAEDPEHPVGTVFAGAAEPKVRSAFTECPSLDFLGVNAYGDDALKLGGRLRQWGWTKPYAIMEFGPTGHWVAPVTEWGAYVEESSSQKAPRYNATCHSCYEDPLCVGSFAFVWGWKWEKTGTWYGLFNEWPAVTDGVGALDCPRCQSEVVSTLEQCWTGNPPSSQTPTIDSIEAGGQKLPDMSFIAPQQSDFRLRVHARTLQNTSVVALWVATRDVVSDAIGGAYEATNPLLASVWPKEGAGAAATTGLEVSLNTSGMQVGGAYRLYLFVRQGRRQEASASLPFRICHTAQPGEACYDEVAYAKAEGVLKHPQMYPGVNASSSFEEFQVLLYQKGEAKCPPPCGIRAWCYTSIPGEECYSRALWAQQHGVLTNPGLYPGLSTNSSLEAFQQLLNERWPGVCPRPCAANGAPVTPPPEPEPDLDGNGTNESEVGGGVSGAGLPPKARGSDVPVSGSRKIRATAGAGVALALLSARGWVR